MLHPLVGVIKPLHQRLEHIFLAGDVQVVVPQKRRQLIDVHAQKFFGVLVDFHEAPGSEAQRELVEIITVLLFGEEREADRVREVELLAEKVGARLNHIRHLEEASAGEDLLDVVLVDG